SLSSGFTDYLENTKLLTMEELNLSGQGFWIANKLKPLQAAPPKSLTVNPKYGKKYQIPNIVNIVAYSNYDLPVKLEQNQRRWYVIKSEAPKLESMPWYTYNRFNEMQSDGAIDQILSYLNRRDISSFNHSGSAPRSDAAESMEMNSITGYRDLAPTIREIEWLELTDLREVKQRLEFEVGRSKFNEDAYLRKILGSLGWVNLGICMKVNGRSVRPWATVRGDLYKQMKQADIRRIWSKRDDNSQITRSELNKDDEQ
ncbi:unnamed protein product, partial [marine sediment metagenome]